MNLWNPKLPISELYFPSNQLLKQLRSDNIHTIGKLNRCSDEQLNALGYNGTCINRIRTALQKHQSFIAELTETLSSDGFTPKMLHEMQPFDLLSLPLSVQQLGYLLRWQHDVGGKYKAKDLFCVVGGRVYYCTKCPYRDERSNFCGFCVKKLLDDMREDKRREHRPH